MGIDLFFLQRSPYQVSRMQYPSFVDLLGRPDSTTPTPPPLGPTSHLQLPRISTLHQGLSSASNSRTSSPAPGPMFIHQSYAPTDPDFLPAGMRSQGESESSMRASSASRAGGNVKKKRKRESTHSVCENCEQKPRRLGVQEVMLILFLRYGR